MSDTGSIGRAAPDAVQMLAHLADVGPYFTVGTGPAPGEGWLPTSALCATDVRDHAVAEMASSLQVTERRVAASTLFFGYAARLWSVALGTRQDDGRCVSLHPDELLWRTTSGSLQLHIERPHLGRSVGAEVLTHQLEPCIDHWRAIVAPGLLWGNTTSALLGAARMIGVEHTRWVQMLLNNPRLQLTIDPETRRRRSCCLFYRTPRGGLCGDCTFPVPPATSSKENP